MSGIARKLIGVTKGVTEIDFIASSAVHSTTTGVTNPLTIQSPVEAQDGDYLLFCGRFGTLGTVTNTDGFLHLAGASPVVTDNITVWGKVNSTDDPSGYVFTRSTTGGTFSGILIVLRGAQIDVVGTLSGTSFTAPSLTATESGYLVSLYTWNQFITSITATPDGMDEIARTDIALAGGNLAYGQAILAGATGDKTLVTSTGVALHSIQISFKGA